MIRDRLDGYQCISLISKPKDISYVTMITDSYNDTRFDNDVIARHALQSSQNLPIFCERTKRDRANWFSGSYIKAILSTVARQAFPLAQLVGDEERQEKMANDVNAELLARLDLLIRLQALSMMSRFESSKEKIQFLDTAGMDTKQIAELLETSPNAVSVTLFKTRKSKSARKRSV